MRDITKITLLLLIALTALVMLAACNNSVEEVSRLPPKAPPPIPGVSVALNADLQTLMTRDGQLTVQLSQDGNETQAMAIDGSTATLTLAGEDMQGEHRYDIGVFYQSASMTTTVRVAEGDKTTSGTQVQFEVGDLKTVPYDKDNSGTVENVEQIRLDTDQDGKSNLAEILELGNPLSPDPTFLSASQVQVPERQSSPGPATQLYLVYTATALSPRDMDLTYSIVGGANRDRFSIDANNGELSFVANANLQWPVYDTTTNNDYLVDIQGRDDVSSSLLSLTVTVTDLFNLSVTVGIKSLQFSWFAVPNAKYYKLLENPDGNSGFTEVAEAAQTSELSFNQAISLYRIDPLNARYQLRAYNWENTLLQTSEELSLNVSLLAAIGFLKALNASAYDQLGVISLSADGGTLAVGAPEESSAPITGGIDIGGNTTRSDCRMGIGSTNCLQYSGAIYLFEKRLGNPNLWDAGDFAAIIKAPNADTGDRFGSSVSLSADGGTLAVGATGEDSKAIARGIKIGGIPVADCNKGNASSNCQILSGAVYLYEKNRGSDPANWDAGQSATGKGDFVAFIKAPNAAYDSNFGASISLSADGSTLAVGASRESTAAPVASGIDISGFPITNGCIGNDKCLRESGAVYLFDKSRGSDTANWDADLSAIGKGDFVAFIKATNASTGNYFGNIVILSADGGTLAVGAPWESSAAIDGWIDTSGSLLSSDCTGANANCLSKSGAVYLFEKIRGSNQANWDEGDFAAFIKAPNASADNYFGSIISLSADGGTLAVGVSKESRVAIAGGIDTGGSPQTSVCTGATPNCLNYSGVVYLFEKGRGSDPVNWDAGKSATGEGDFSAFIKAINPGMSEGFGVSLSLSADGGTLAVGASWDSSAAIANGIDTSGSPQPNDCALGNASTNCLFVSGAVYLFEKGRGSDAANWDAGQSASGKGDFVAFIKAPNADAENYFGGVSLSADGGTLAVVAAGESSAAIANGISSSDKLQANDCRASLQQQKNCLPLSGAVYLY